MLNKIRNIQWRQVGYFFLGIASLVGVGMLMSLVSKKDQVQVCTSLKVLVEGKETFIDQQDISSMIQDKFGRVVGKNLNEIPLQKIENELKKSPYVSEADVHMDMDGTMQVQVMQREVVLRVINQMGQEYYVDSKNKKIPVTLKYVPHVMVANGNIKEGYKKALEPVQSSLVKDLVNVVEHTKHDELWSNQIVQLFVNSDRDIEIVPRVGEQALIIGSADSLDYKLNRLTTFYKHIMPRVGTGAYSKVNVKYGGQIICERNGDWFIDSLQMKMNKK
ncbi:cell division protein FtsQ/DivIB [Sphingobacterium sp. BN32]|uniref:cell division protein FtsQ/DivIB n=1 Tax=Sphingobacterium sp. BN32 TaxID=3058432 RepID=UPI00265CEACB|nr:cell division protein FtsQ [Sphingobacterium sp. BN32]WKK57730.1 cell division protein FtsQ [Sphingobacterium sp. BN32]